MLKQYGLIDFKLNGTKATEYKLNTMSNSLQDSLQGGCQDSLQDGLQDSLQVGCTLNKLNKTKLNQTKQERKVKKKTNFSPPSFEEIQTYIRDSGLNVDAKKFFDYFNATNWIDSKGNKVKSWKGKLQTWSGFNKPTTTNRLDDSNMVQLEDLSKYYANI